MSTNQNHINPDSFHGLLLVNKIIGISSFYVVKKIRALTKVKKTGHAGTLDPFASGLLIIAIGRNFTRQIDSFKNLSKTYKVKMVLGIETDTLDSYGNYISYNKPVFYNKDLQVKTAKQITETISSFTGEQLQVPPRFSAKKIDGKRMYKMARQNIDFQVKPEKINIFDIKVDNISFYTRPVIDFTVCCSKGTYIRSLVKDIGTAMKGVAYTKDIIRVKIGSYNLSSAVDFSLLSSETIKKGLFFNTSETESI
ncbi:MAG: tRNA pseudouridine(55) synthase TruB [bacterium]|nr:tRNA pseudouridine(55) synthase TruB [bacterium]